MKRIIVDYAKLTNEILTMLVDKFPDGYDDSNIVKFRNAQNEMIEAVEVRTEDTIYLVKVSTKLANTMENYDEDDDLNEEGVAPIDKEVEINDDDEMDEDEDEIDPLKDSGGSDDNDDDDDDDYVEPSTEDDEDEEDY